jgi:TP901 family phage tail tape measure protein
MATVAQLLIELRAGSAKLVSDLNKSMSHVRKFERQVGRVGKTLTTNVSLPLGAMAAGAVRASIEFESAFAGVKKTFDDTGKSAKQTAKELDGISKGIRQMSREIPASAPQIAKVVELTQQMGVKGKKNVLTFARAMIDLGESTDIIATDATLKLAKFMSVMNTAPADATRLGSSIVDLGNKFSTTESEIVEMATRLSVTTNRLKISEAETLGMAAALTSLGIRAEAGGTAFSRFLIDMAAAVDKGGDSLEQFAAVAGVSVD